LKQSPGRISSIQLGKMVGDEIDAQSAGQLTGSMCSHTVSNHEQMTGSLPMLAIFR
jgi:hypothetical protein